MKFMIIGAGIAGLTAALRLAELGHEVEIFESVDEIRPLGVGIILLPHATAELARAGVLEELLKVSHPISEIEFRTPRGVIITRDRRDGSAGYRTPKVAVLRSSLHQVLFNAVVERIGADRVRLAHRLQSFEWSGDRVFATFVHPKTMDTVARAEADALIGADGVHSTVFQRLYPNLTPHRFSGVTMWRGITEARPIYENSTMLSCGHWMQRLIVFPMGRVQDDRAPLNWVAEIRGYVPDRERFPDGRGLAMAEDFRNYYRDWRLEDVDPIALFDEAKSIMMWPMLDRDPLDRWAFGPVVLVGDAAHPIYPYGANGAAQALLDVGALSRALEAHPRDPAAAFRVMEEERLPKMRILVATIRTMGQERVQEVVRERCRGACTAGALCTCVPQEELKHIIDDFKHKAGFMAQEPQTRGTHS